MDKTMSKILKNHTKWSQIAISIVLVGTSWLETSYLCFEGSESLHTK